MKSLKIIYIIGFVLLAVYIAAQFSRPKPVDWNPTLSYQDKIPFGTYILYHELPQIFKDAGISGTNSTFFNKFHVNTDSAATHPDTVRLPVHSNTDSAAVVADTDSTASIADTNHTINTGTDTLPVTVDTSSAAAASDTSSMVVKSNYIIISKSANISKLDFTEMVKYMEEGNSIFIATDAYVRTGIKQSLLPDTLKFGINSIDLSDVVEKNVHTLNFTNSKLRRKGGFRFDRGIASQYFESFDTTRAVVLCKNESGKATLIRYDFGKGSLFLCANPELFTNYAIVRGHGAEYVSKALSYMPAQPIIYWDHLQNGDVPEDESPMRVIFSRPMLTWAYYIALFGMIVFVLYEMKRRQRIIPVIEPLANSTVDFVNVVGRVYYEQRNNTNIAQKKILYFLEHLRNTYYLKTNKLDKEFVEKMAQKTGIDPEFAGELVAHIHYVTGQRVSDQDLMKQNQLIEQFYIKSR